MTVLPGSLAAVLATATAALLFPSFVAAEYRRHGGLRAGVGLRCWAVLAYALAVACYVLLPTSPGCFAAQLHPLAGLNSSASLGQFLGNIALFTPLGVLLRRSPAAATLVGLAASTLIELTQLTGLWFSFPCPYRVFDINDIIANTFGASLGGLATRTWPLPTASEPNDSPLRRRLLGMSCDAVVLCWLHVACAGIRPLPALIVLITMLPTGTTLGQQIVLLRAHNPHPRAVVLRWALGSGGLALALECSEALHGPTLVVALLWCGVHAVAVSQDRDQQGITGRVSGLELHDVRAPQAVRTS